MAVRLVVAPSGKIRRVVDPDGHELEYAVVPVEAGDEGSEDEEGVEGAGAADDGVDALALATAGLALDGSADAGVLRAAGHRGNYLCAFCTPTARAAPGHMFPQGVAWLLDGNAQPPADAFPLDFTTGSGLTLVEVQLSGAAALSAAWFSDERAAAVRHALRGDGSATGLVSDPALLDGFLREHTHPWLADDPFLCPFRDPDGADGAWTPAAGDKDFVGVFVSTWKTVETRVAQSSAHDETQPTHFYVAVRGALDDEAADQLRMAAICRAGEGATWADVAASEEAGRARALGRWKRLSLLERACAALDVVPRGAPSHTETNVFGPADGDAVLFYAGCSSSLEAGPGRAVLVGTRGEPGVLWLHGPHTGEVGGGAWRAGDAGHAVPEWVPTMEDDVLAAFITNGFDVEYGFAELYHTRTLHAGRDVLGV